MGRASQLRVVKDREGPPLRVLLVCTGNLCRSPLAEALLRRLARERGVSLETRSRGVEALEGEPPPPETIRAGRELGVDLEGHRGRRLRVEDLEWAQRVLVMEPWQKGALEGMKAGSGKVEGLWAWAPGGPGEIPDPYMEGGEAHLETARLLEAALEAWLEEL